MTLLTISARISYPLFDSVFLRDEGGRFIGILSPVWNSMLVDGTGLNFTSMNVTDPPGALRLLQEGIVDVHTYPFPINSIASMPSEIEVIQTGFETIQAIGTIFPPDLDRGGDKVVKSMLGMVNVDIPTIILAITFFLLTWVGLSFAMKIKSLPVREPRVIRIKVGIRPVDHMYRLNLDIGMRLVEDALKQPNFNPIRFTGSIPSFLVGLFLLFTMYFMIVYCNMFSTELIVENPIPRIDTLEQLEQSNRTVVPESSGLLQQLIKSQKVHSPVLKLLKQRIPECFMIEKGDERKVDMTRCERKIPECFMIEKRDERKVDMTRCERKGVIYPDLIEQRAVQVQSVYYHKITERFSCIAKRTNWNQSSDHAPNQRINRYYVSKEKFLPMLLMYVARRNLPMPIRGRFKFLFTSFSEHGLEIAHQGFIPQLATGAMAGKDQQAGIDACVRNKFLESKNEGLEQSSINLESLIDVALLCSRIMTCALVCLIGEIFYRKCMRRKFGRIMI